GTPLTLPSWYDWSSAAGQGRYFYVANGGSDSWYMYDISNPLAPTQVGSVINTGNPSYGIAAQGRYVYVTIGNTLQVYDVSNPSSPVTVGSAVATTSTPMAVSVQGQYAYVYSG